MAEKAQEQRSELSKLHRMIKIISVIFVLTGRLMRCKSLSNVFDDVIFPIIRRLQIKTYDLAVAKFEEGRYNNAIYLFRLYLLITGQPELFHPRRTRYGTRGQRLTVKNENAIRTFLDAKQKNWLAGALPVASYVAHEKQSSVGPSPIVGRKVLFLFPEHIFNSKDYIKSDYEDHFLETAKDAGLVTDIYYTDSISYIEFQHTREEGNAELASLRDYLAQQNPDVIVFDANFYGQESTINPLWLKSLRNVCKARLVAVVGDAYSDEQIPLADHWGEVSDLVVHSAPRSPFKQKSSARNRVMLIPWPVNRCRFFPSEIKNYDISFVGNYSSSLRPYWLSVCVKAAESVAAKTLLRPHQRNLKQALDFDEYARILRESRMVLNFSTHIFGAKALTGRVWQSVASGVVVLEEENDPITEFFVPFIHYIPFANATELSLMIAFLKKNAAYADFIAKSAANWSMEHYSSRTIWERIFFALDSDTER